MGGGLMTVTDGFASHPIRMHGLHYGSPLLIERVEPIHNCPAEARRDEY